MSRGTKIATALVLVACLFGHISADQQVEERETSLLADMRLAADAEPVALSKAPLAASPPPPKAVQLEALPLLPIAFERREKVIAPLEKGLIKEDAKVPASGSPLFASTTLKTNPPRQQEQLEHEEENIYDDDFNDAMPEWMEKGGYRTVDFDDKTLEREDQERRAAAAGRRHGSHGNRKHHRGVYEKPYRGSPPTIEKPLLPTSGKNTKQGSTSSLSDDSDSSSSSRPYRPRKLSSSAGASNLQSSTNVQIALAAVSCLLAFMVQF